MSDDEQPAAPTADGTHAAFTRAIDDLRLRIGQAGATPWRATGNRPPALMRRAYLRALRPYLRRRAEIDMAALAALQTAGDILRAHDAAIRDARERADRAEDRRARDARDGRDAIDAVARACERARRDSGRMAVALIEATTARGGALGATVCTIVSRQTIGHAHALARSLARVHPGTRLIALVTDGEPHPTRVPFTSVTLDDVMGDAAAAWSEGHQGVALEYALTPSLILYLLEHGHGKVVFIKQESMVVGSLEPIIDALGDAGIGLTPHLIAPPSGADADERLRHVMLAGTFNGGVIAVNDTPGSRRALDWWESRLRQECAWDVERGRHYEQRWLDLLAMTFDDVAIMRGPGLNLGHWNIADRCISGPPGGVRADGHEVAVFRLSGFQPDEPDVVTRYAPNRLAGGLPTPLDIYLLAFREELLTWAVGVDP